MPRWVLICTLVCDVARVKTWENVAVTIPVAEDLCKGHVSA